MLIALLANEVLEEVPKLLRLLPPFGSASPGRGSKTGALLKLCRLGVDCLLSPTVSSRGGAAGSALGPPFIIDDTSFAVSWLAAVCCIVASLSRLMSSKCVISERADSVSDRDEEWNEDDLESVRPGGEDSSRVAGALISSQRIAESINGRCDE